MLCVTSWTLAVPQVPQEVREARRDELVSLQQRIGEEWAGTHVGQEVRGGGDRLTGGGDGSMWREAATWMVHNCLQAGPTYL